MSGEGTCPSLEAAGAEVLAEGAKGSEKRAFLASASKEACVLSQH